MPPGAGLARLVTGIVASGWAVWALLFLAAWVYFSRKPPG